MESGNIIWKRMDIKDLIQGMVTGEMEQQHLTKGMLKIKMDQGLEVNLVEQDLTDIEVSQEEMEIDVETDLDIDHQDRKVSWKRMWKRLKG